MSFLTSQAPLSSAEICRQQSWVPGTVLEAVWQDGFSTARVEITAIGRRSILGEPVMVDGVALEPGQSEFIWDLRCRDWRAV